MSRIEDGTIIEESIDSASGVKTTVLKYQPPLNGTNIDQMMINAFPDQGPRREMGIKGGRRMWLHNFTATGAERTTEMCPERGSFYCIETRFCLPDYPEIHHIEGTYHKKFGHKDLGYLHKELTSIEVGIYLGNRPLGAPMFDTEEEAADFYQTYCMERPQRDNLHDIFEIFALEGEKNFIYNPGQYSDYEEIIGDKVQRYESAKLVADIMSLESGVEQTGLRGVDDPSKYDTALLRALLIRKLNDVAVDLYPEIMAMDLSEEQITFLGTLIYLESCAVMDNKFGKSSSTEQEEMVEKAIQEGIAETLSTYYINKDKANCYTIDFIRNLRDPKFILVMESDATDEEGKEDQISWGETYNFDKYRFNFSRGRGRFLFSVSSVLSPDNKTTLIFPAKLPFQKIYDLVTPEEPLGWENALDLLPTVS